jgi:hypothetical protein
MLNKINVIDHLILLNVNIQSQEIHIFINGFMSKELLGEVLKADIRKINNSILDGNLYYYKTFVKCKSKINIYELANKCKEWALNKGYMMKIENHYLNSTQIQIRKTMANSIYKEPWKKTFKSEVEAIIEAAQFIFDNNKGNYND